jgi:hypothetical protein
MPKRRKVLIGLGGSIAIAGCSGDTEEEPQQEQTDTDTEEKPEQEETEEQNEPEPVFEFVSISPENGEFLTTEEIDVEVEVKNTGNGSGRGIIEFRIQDGYEAAKEIELESGEVTTLNFSFEPTDIDPGDIGYSFHSEDDSISSEFILEEPLEEWEKEMQKAEDLWQDALNSYTSQGDGPTDSILDVMFSTDFDWVDSHSLLTNAQEEISNARGGLSPGTEERETVDEARTEVNLVMDLVRYQPEHHKLYEAIGSLLELLRDEGGAVSSLDTISERSTLEEDVEELKENFEDLDPVFSTSELYTTKMDQMESELDVTEGTVTGINYILDPGFGTQQERAALAKREFSDVLDTLEGETAYPPEEAVDQEYIDTVAGWRTLAEEIEREHRVL